MRFNRHRYLDEMRQLVTSGCKKLLAEHPQTHIYTVAIWTDPDACISAISFDTLANSRNRAREIEEFRAREYERWMKMGDEKMARHFEPRASSRLRNPAEFQMREIATLHNSSVPHHWEEQSHGACWKELEPALDEVAIASLVELSELPLEDDALLGVNGQKDWFERTWRISPLSKSPPPVF